MSYEWSKAYRTYREIDTDVWVCVQDVTAVERVRNGAFASRVHLIGGDTLVVDATVKQVMAQIAKGIEKGTEHA